MGGRSGRSRTHGQYPTAEVGSLMPQRLDTGRATPTLAKPRLWSGTAPSDFQAPSSDQGTRQTLATWRNMQTLCH